jgi:hypothetical protein
LDGTPSNNKRGAFSLSLFFAALSLSLSLVPLIAEGEREMVIIIIKKRIFRYIYSSW